MEDPDIVFRNAECTKKEAEMDLDDFLESMGDVSWYQVLSAIGTGLLCFTLSLMIMLPSFLTATPQHRCAVPDFNSSKIFFNMTNKEIQDLLIPRTHDQQIDSCYRYAYNLSACYDQDNSSCLANYTEELVQCDYGYHFDQKLYQSSVVTEWNLVCDRSTLKSISNSLFFFGFFIGSIVFGLLADWFGRRFTMLIVSIGNLGIGLGVAFAPVFEVYVLFYIGVASAAIGGYIVTYTYVGEISSKKRRRDFMLIDAMLGSLGNVFIAPLAYFFRNWRNLEMVCCLITLIYIPIYFFLSESPRWLLLMGREEDAKTVLRRYFGSKELTFSLRKWEMVLKSERKKRKKAETQKKYSVIDLFKTPHLRIMSINVMFTWFVSSMVYYGLVLNVGNLAGDPYINTAISSTMDVVATASTFFLMRYISKSYLLCASFLVAGTSCLASMLLLEFDYTMPSVILACIGRLGASCSYRTTYVLTAELFPTVIRGTGMSLGSLSARVGGMVSPFTIQAQESLPWLMQTIFGSLSIVAGLLSLLYPDTNNIKLMSTLEEAEDFCAANLSRFCQSKPKKIKTVELKVVNTVA